MPNVVMLPHWADQGVNESILSPFPTFIVKVTYDRDGVIYTQTFRTNDPLLLDMDPHGERQEYLRKHFGAFGHVMTVQMIEEVELSLL